VSNTKVLMQQPKPGDWYINRTGKLMKVKMVLLGATGPETVLLQYVEGLTVMISMSDWQCLDLVVPHDTEEEAVFESDQSL